MFGGLYIILTGLILYFLDDESDGDFDVDDIDGEIQAANLTVFSQFDSDGEVGSVHTGPVKMRVSETSIPGDEVPDFDHFNLPGTRRTIVSSRKNMEICGGQGYLPLFKLNSLVDQRQGMEELGHLPLLTQRLLTSPQGSFDQDKTALTTELISKFHALDTLLGTMTSELKNTAKNTVRFEFFVTTTFRNSRCDITLPDPDPWHLLFVIDHETFKSYWSSHLEVYLDPFRRFVDDLKLVKKTKQGILVSGMTASIRTTLVLCIERCVEASNILGFRGRILQTIWKELKHWSYDQQFFILPATCVEEVPAHRYALKKPLIAAQNPGKRIHLCWRRPVLHGFATY
jgi:hypothetical protein